MAKRKGKPKGWRYLCIADEHVCYVGPEGELANLPLGIVLGLQAGKPIDSKLGQDQDSGSVVFTHRRKEVARIPKGLFAVLDDLAKDLGTVENPAIQLDNTDREILESCTEATALEILSFVREYLAGYKVPKSVEFREELPKGGTGKILKKELREPYWEGLEKRVH